MSYKINVSTENLVQYSFERFESISWALGNPSFSNPATLAPSCTSHNDMVVQEAGDIINDLLHNELRQPSEMCRISNPLELNINEHLNKINPLLVRFIKLITCTVRERHHPHLQSESATAKQTKHIRQYFIISLLMYSINPNHSSLLHNILADIVEVCGGSRLLMKVLNKLGCASSDDTHDQFVTEWAEEKRESQIWDELPAEVFTIASIGKFDML